jgi:diphthamide synthase subunit DPH2
MANEIMEQPRKRSHMIEDELAVRLPNHDILSTPVLKEAVEFFVHHGHEVKKKAETLAVDCMERGERIKNVHAIVQELNNLAKEDGSKLDIKQHASLVEKLRKAKEHGVNITMHEDDVKTEFTPGQRDRLVENLNMSATEWNTDIKNYQQKMTVFIQESERFLMLAHDVKKNEERPKRKMIDGISR